MTPGALIGILLVVTVTILLAVALFSLIFGIDLGDIFGDDDE